MAERRLHGPQRVSGTDGHAGSEAEYDSILVAFDDSRYRPTVMATASKLAARRRRGIHVLVTVTVPASASLEDERPDLDMAAASVIEQARIQGGRRVTGHIRRVRAGQAGRVIVEEAREMRAAAIVMPLVRRGGSTVFGKTLETVLAQRPCRVIIEADPAARGRRGLVR